MLSVIKLVTIAKSAPKPNQNIRNPVVAISAIKNTPAAINQNTHITTSLF